VPASRREEDWENEDRWQRWLVERRAPQSWKGLGVWALVFAIGVGVGFLWTPGLVLAVLGFFQVVRGLFAIVLKAIFGTGQPVERYMRRRFSWWTREDD
jgi:hypothetical protein